MDGDEKLQDEVPHACCQAIKVRPLQLNIICPSARFHVYIRIELAVFYTLQGGLLSVLTIRLPKHWTFALRMICNLPSKFSEHPPNGCFEFLIRAAQGCIRPTSSFAVEWLSMSLLRISWYVTCSEVSVDLPSMHVSISSTNPLGSTQHLPNNHLEDNFGSQLHVQSDIVGHRTLPYVNLLSILRSSRFPGYFQPRTFWCNQILPYLFSPQYNQTNRRQVMPDGQDFSFCVQTDAQVADQVLPGLSLACLMIPKSRHFADMFSSQPLADRSPKPLNFDPYVAQRIGEASHPGPRRPRGLDKVPQKFIRMMLLNPTAVLWKVPQILEYNPHVVLLAENSATEAVQKTTTALWRSKGYQSVWSEPVQAHLSTIRAEGAMRGIASGVSQHSVHPCRPSRVSVSKDVDPTRIISTITHFGKIQVHIVTLYGYPNTYPQAKAKTDQLVQEAARLIEAVQLPAVIAGDFNHHLDTLLSVQVLRSLQYQTTADLYPVLNHEVMPPTCRDATCIDQMIFHPHLIHFIHKVQVHPKTSFHDHCPVTVDFDLDITQPTVTQFASPKSWVAYQPDPEKIAAAFEQRINQEKIFHVQPEETTFSDVLVRWTLTCENAIGDALKQQHAANPDLYPQPNLPAACRGRMQPPKQTKFRAKFAIKAACSGQYTPQIEVANHKILQRVKQIRRLESLLQRILKLPQHHPAPKDLYLEWHAIKRAKGFKSFPHWCAQIPELPQFPLHFPTAEYLQLLIPLLRHHTDDLIFHHSQHKQSLAKFKTNYDQKHGQLRHTMRNVKGSAQMPVEEIHTTQRYPARLISQDMGLVEISVQPDQPFQLHLPVVYADQTLMLISLDDHQITAMLNDADVELPAHSDLQQSQQTADPETIANALDQYWSSFWQRDAQSLLSSDPVWAPFEQYLADTPQIPLMQVNIQDPHNWMRAAHKMKSATARGSDGWHVDDLKTLPLECFQLLADIFYRFQNTAAFPDKLNHAITFPLFKKPQNFSTSNTRPITILPMLYRLWAKVTTTEILKQWATLMPPQIIGFLPGRSPQTEMMAMQLAFEKDHKNPHRQFSWQGLTLDLVKCFNLIPRYPAKVALQRAGVPSECVNFWYNTLNQTNRVWKILQRNFLFSTTTTGTPEGDSWSVLTCIALSRVWIHHAKTGTVLPTAYADNWAYRCKTTQENQDTIELTKSFTDSLFLKIDWTKTWCWSTQTTGKPRWKSKMREIFPPAVAVQFLATARELGYTLHYNKVHSRATQKQRHDIALKHIAKAKNPQLSLHTRAKICAFAITRAFWGTETYAVGSQWYKQIRSAIAKTLLFDKKHTNPYLATMCLSKHVCDPEYYVIRQTLRAARLFLQRALPDIAADFLHLASAPAPSIRNVWGPAGTLAFQLAKLGWSINNRGVVYTDTHYEFSLIKENRLTYEKFLQHSWMKHLSQFCLNRQEWKQTPIIDRQATLKLIASLPEDLVPTTTTYVTGASMTAQQTHHFTEDDTTCRLCSMEDSVTHRLLDCPATQHLRGDHEQIVAHLREVETIHHSFPLVYQSPWFEFNHVYHQTRPPPQLSQVVLDNMRQEARRGLMPQVFSDGSCVRPTHEAFRRAAFAVVYHPRITQEQAKAALHQYHQHSTMISTFQVLTTAETAGVQTIPRAELQAIMPLMALDYDIEVVTDSAYVMETMALLETVDDLNLLSSLNNFDLLQAMFSRRRTHRLHLVKVKAHALDSNRADIDDQWLKLGNEMADRTAKMALQHFQAIVPLHLDFAEHLVHINLRRLQFEYFHQVHTTRARAIEQLDLPEPLGTQRMPWTQQIQVLAQWVPQQFIQIDRLPEDNELAKYCIWGAQFMLDMLDWAALLKWPDPPQSPMQSGVSWMELTLSFMICTQKGIMHNEGQAGLEFKPRRLPFNCSDTELSKQVSSFERAFQTVQFLINRTLHHGQRQLTRSLRIIGACQGRNGLNNRPSFPFQTEIVELLHEHFKSNLPGPPILPVQLPVIQNPENPQDEMDWANGWNHRISRYRQFRSQRHRANA